MNAYSLIVFASVTTLAVVLVECRPSGLSIFGPKSPLSGHPMIIGGQDAYDGQFPDLLELEYYGSVGWKHICGAMILSDYYALTAAKCVKDLNTINLRLFAGLLVRENYTLTNSHQLSINQITVHTDYNEYLEGTPNDIAIIRFAWAVNLTRPNIAITKLPADDSNDFSGSVGIIAGWGRYGLEQVFAWTLQWASTNILTNAQCQQYMTGITNAVVNDKTHVCTLSEPLGTGVCSGDSGSPLYAGSDDARVLVGLGSWTVMSNGYCNENFPQVFTRVSSFLDWITVNTPAYP